MAIRPHHVLVVRGNFPACACAALLLAVSSASRAQRVLSYEAEDVTAPASAWLVNKHTEGHWNLWSTDKDAMRKWSEGIVLQSPIVREDRERPEDGAPVLHTRITDIPPGTYDIELSARTRTMGVSLDGKTWQPFGGGILLRDAEVKNGVFELWVDDRYVNRGGNPGSTYYDRILFHPIVTEYESKPPLPELLTERAVERLDRGVVAMRTGDGAYVSWRLLQTDPDGIVFNVYRKAGGDTLVKLNPTPVMWTTDFIDRHPPETDDCSYLVRAVIDGEEGDSADSARLQPLREGLPYVAIKLDGDHTFQKVGIADLDGDGQYDYVIKQPNANIDPWHKYWKPSPETYKIEAYDHDGRFLWRNDLGWGIERGIWYSPYIVYDLDGDGKAEVAAKAGEGDPRDEDGHVTSGPEWLVVWDGLTGKERCRVPWPKREDFSAYNYASRNQLAVAYLDGKTPCIVAMRGTYKRMRADAYALTPTGLRALWQYDNKDLGRRLWGQGAHFTHSADVDGDGRDEVVLGSVVIDDSGVPLWSTGKGHPDHCYVGDIDPRRPGLEIYYGVETRSRKGAMCMADARTGDILWEWGEPTRHVHSTGMCSDIDPTRPGMECYSADADGHKLTDKRWMWSATGKVMTRELLYGFTIRTAYWDADLQREIVAKTISDYEGGVVSARIEGKIVLVADVIGDWREEIIASVPGELRIYSTTISATDRRPCLMQDPIYRLDVAMTAMGYTQVPMTSYCLAATTPGMNLTAVPADSADGLCRIVVSAPLDRSVTGAVTVTTDRGVATPERFQVDVAPGERHVESVSLRLSDAVAEPVNVRARLTGDNLELHGQVTVAMASGPITDGHIVQAEAISEQGGGEVQIREDKTGVVGKAISHWDDEGHWLAWPIAVPAGRYRLIVRYSTPDGATRKLSIDDNSCGAQHFPGTGGYGSLPREWNHAYAEEAEGTPLVLDLDAGEHTIRMENADGKGLNLDYLALVPAE